MCSDLNLTMRKKLTQSCRKEKKLFKCFELVREFKVAGVKVFAEYQVLDGRTQKWHMCDHVFYALIDVGCFEYLYASWFGRPYCNFKQSFRKLF